MASCKSLKHDELLTQCHEKYNSYYFPFPSVQIWLHMSDQKALWAVCSIVLHADFNSWQSLRYPPSVKAWLKVLFTLTACLSAVVSCLLRLTWLWLQIVSHDATQLIKSANFREYLVLKVKKEESILVISLTREIRYIQSQRSISNFSNLNTESLGSFTQAGSSTFNKCRSLESDWINSWNLPL